ncbi:malto-oligosyltrehalose trehalohydrolase [Actinotalea sp. M2MS4P-6]|uniref:malto-oligosyltrehalose trehalohydrolase n=1 Tax=Actinotalea sp. M2MS4P-6 TaxID=2983762 RepID=UPI0021E43361|nr:malto-oligosyltrehalose trehalohydrolase [Actinotalea sp. M2MS4P-6]MCV2396314.1 malto-oligosyltrehalose trehalohydrolase [Actinotalea sp. M2MS4P-6]
MTSPDGWSDRGWLPRVWAPGAGSVTLHHGPGGIEASRPMTRLEAGWWTSDVALGHGTDYAFAPDGADPLPDPRSAWQPHGVHGPSRVFDPRRHTWTDADWTGVDARGAVAYELHVGTFTPEGTLDAAIGRLDHLVALGVQLVELMPLAAFPGVAGWGYDGVALYAVHDPYGGPAALQRFVDAAHRAGIGVCLDVVYNHLGPSGNYLMQFGPYFTDTHETPWGWAVNLDAPHAAGMRSFLIDNATRWLRDFHLDALRLDAVHALADDSERHLLAELADAVALLAAELGRPLSLVAESDLNDATMVTPTAEGGLGMTAQWADDVHHALHAWVTGERHGYYGDFGDAATLAHALTRVFVHEGGWSTFRGRPWGAPVPPGTDGHRFVVFAQNHDQVGNRALGDRPSARLAPALLALEAAAVLTSPFTPMLFMGEEWGARTPFQFFTDHAEPDLVEGIRRGRAQEFAGHGWEELYGGPPDVPDPQSPATVEASRLDWSEPEHPDHARMLTWYRTLVALRANEPDLASGDLDTTGAVAAPDGTWVVLHRGRLRVVLHRGDGPTRVPLGGTAVEVLAAWEPLEAGLQHVTLRGPGAAVVRVSEEDR